MAYQLKTEDILNNHEYLIQKKFKSISTNPEFMLQLYNKIKEEKLTDYLLREFVSATKILSL